MLAAYHAACRDLTNAQTQWSRAIDSGLAAFNAVLTRHGRKPVAPVAAVPAACADRGPAGAVHVARGCCLQVASGHRSRGQGAGGGSLGAAEHQPHHRAGSGGVRRAPVPRSHCHLHARPRDRARQRASPALARPPLHFHPRVRFCPRRSHPRGSTGSVSVRGLVPSRRRPVPERRVRRCGRVVREGSADRSGPERARGLDRLALDVPEPRRPQGGSEGRAGSTFTDAAPGLRLHATASALRGRGHARASC